jgi:hypothetical protein
VTRFDDRVAVLGLLVLVAVVHSQALFGGQVFFWRDIAWLWYPRIASFGRTVSEGAWPIWEPHTAFGLPALADPSGQLAYPPTWLSLAMPLSTYYTLFAVLHTLGAGLGLFHLARRWGVSSFAAAVAAAGWMTCGPVLSFVNVHHFAGLAWMPWVILMLDVALERATLGSALGLGGVAAGQILTGSGDLSLMTAVIGLARAGGFLWARRSEGVRPAARLLRTGLIAALFALSLSAVQWLPTAAVTPRGSRLSMPFEAKTFWSLHPVALLDLVVPNLVARFPMSAAVRAAVWSSREPFLVSHYWGMGLAFFAAMGILLGRSPMRWLSGGLCLFFVICALGSHTPLYSFLCQSPPFSILRYPVKYLAGASLGAALLAGFGLDAWLAGGRGRESRRGALLAVAFLGIAGTGWAAAHWVASSPERLAGIVRDGAGLSDTIGALRLGGTLAAAFGLLAWVWVHRGGPTTARTALAVALALGEVTRVGRETVGLMVVPEAIARYQPAWIPGLRAGSATSRIHAVPVPREVRATARSPHGWNPDWWWTVGVVETLAPPIGARWGLDGSFDGDVAGLSPAPLGVLSATLYESWGTPFALRLLQVGGVDYVTSVAEERWLGTPIREEAMLLGGRLRIYRVPDPLPRAYLVGGARVEAEPQSYRVLLDPGFDPRREVLLAEGSARPGDPEFSGTATLLRRRSDALSVDVVLDRDGYLVVLDGFDPAWTATVDGAPARVSRANVLFRAVPVPAGRHVVEMRYRPASVRWGVGLSLAAAASGLASIWALRRRRA